MAAWRKRGRPATSWSGTNPGTEAFVPTRVTERGAPPMLALRDFRYISGNSLFVSVSIIVVSFIL